MVAPSKTQATSLISLQSVAASSVLIGSVVDVSAKFAGSVFIHFGRRSASAAGAGVNFRVEGSAKSSADGFWFPLAIFTSGFAATNSQPVTTSSSSGQNVVSMSTTTNMAVGDIVYIDDPTIGNSEWGRVKTVTASTSITLEDNLQSTHGTSAVVYRAAELYMTTPNIDLSSVGRLRVVADGSQFTQAFAVEAFLTTLDSIA